MGFKSFLPRAISVFLVAQLPIWIIADALAPLTSSVAYESNMNKVVEQLATDKSPRHCTEIAQHLNLSWIHLADKSKKVSVSTRPAGLSEAGTESSKVVDIKGGRFVEISRQLPDGGAVSVGFRCTSLMDSLFSKQVYPGQLPFGTVATALALNLIAFIAAYLAFLGIPLSKTISRINNGLELPDQFPAHVSSELADIGRGLKRRFSSMHDEHERSMQAARSDLSGVFAKEVEERFLNKLTKDALTQETSGAVCDLVMRRIADEFIGIIKASFGVEFGPGGMKIIADWGFSDEQKKVLAALGNSRFAALVKKVNSSVALIGDEIADKRLEQLVSDLGGDQCLVEPVAFDGHVALHMCMIVSSKDSSTMQKLERTLNKTLELVSPIWQLVASFENAYRLSRFDLLTGVRNRTYLEDVLASMRSAGLNGDGTQTIFLVFEGDNFRTMLNSYGPRTIDKLIAELSQQILTGLENSVRFKKASARIAFADFYYRVGGCRFLLILEDSNIKKATEFAETVNEAIMERKDWAHGMPSWSVSCAIAPLDSSQSTPQDCLEEALITLDYLRANRQTATNLLSSDVPEAFMSRAQSRSGGSTGPFDPVAILDAMAREQKSGVLTASSFGGKIFWSYLENGRPSKARLGDLTGDAAIVEFITTFVDGSYRLQDLSTLDAASAEDVKNLGGAYLTQMSLPEVVDFSLKAKESWVAAQKHLKNPDMIVHPTLDKEPDQIKNLFHRTGINANKVYFKVANNLWDQCSGRLSFDEIVEKMNSSPIALVWTAADFLLKNRMIKFSRLRVSAYTDGSDRDKDIAQVIARSPAPKSRKTSDFMLVSRKCARCGASDPLSQKFCVHCGGEMVAAVKLSD